VDVVGRTDVGRTREHNEDSFLVADLTTGRMLPDNGVDNYPAGERGLLFAVADGMGGAAAGEIASDMAVQSLMETLCERWTAAEVASTPEGFAQALREATEAANERIHLFALQHPEYRGMGTTATIAGLLGDTLYLAQVGDSRAYLVRGGEALQLTKDQSLMQQLVEAGEITPEEAERSERRNIILQALGPESTVAIDLTDQPVRRGDVLLLCSDGLSSIVGKQDIARAVQEEPDLDAVCRRLIAQANESGGPDNITVVAARLVGEALREPSVGDTVGYHSYGSLTPATRDPGQREQPSQPAQPVPPQIVRPAPVVPRREGQKWVAVLGGLAVLLALYTLWRFVRP
jgi:protein phosphatase